MGISKWILASFGLFLPAFGLIVPVAAGYPEHAVHFVVPFEPGGTSDVLARLIGQKLAEKWGEPVVIENRSGANGVIGAATVARSAPDGYTIMMTTSAHSMTAAEHKLDYDPVRDFTQITNIGFSPNVLLINSSLPVSSLPQLIDYARSRPGQLNYSSSGPGTAPFMLMEMLKQEAGIDVVHIPYNGTTAAMRALLGNEVQMMFVSVSSLKQIAEGQLKALAVSGQQRLPQLPDVPTVAESTNLPAIEGGTWYGVMAPAKLPNDILNKLHDDIVATVRTPEIEKFLSDQGTEIIADTPKEFEAFLTDDIARSTQIMKGLKPN